MKASFLPILLVSLTLGLQASDPVTFVSKVGGEEHDRARAVTVTDDGYVIAGYTDSFTRHRNDNAYLVKLNKEGTKEWSIHFGTGEDERIYDMTQSSDGGYLLTGMSEALGNDRQSAYLAKVSPKGKLLWHHGYWRRSNALYTSKGVVESYGKGFILAATQERPKFFNKAVDIFLVGTDEKGKQIATRYYGGKDEDRAEAIIKDDGGYVIAGSTESWGEGEKNMYLIKTDKNGDRIWHQVYGGDDDDVANDLIATDDGYVLVGTTDSFDLTQDDVYVVKVDKKGKRLWHHIYGGGKDEVGNAIIEDVDGYVIVGGTKSTGKRSYEMDVYLFKIAKKDGKLLWQRTFGEDGDDIGYDIAKTDDGYIIVGDSEEARTRYSDDYVIKTDKNGRINKQ